MPVTTRRKELVSHDKTNASSSSTELHFTSSTNKKRRIGISQQQQQQTSPSEIFYFQGKEYGSYVEMVEAKRERNRQMLESSGLLDTAKLIRSEQQEKSITKPSKRGLAAIKPKSTSNNTVPPPIRKSKRLAGVSSEQIYVEHESHGKIVVNTSSAGHPTTDTIMEANQKFFNDRINDGSDLTLEQATLLCGEKWRTPLLAAQKFVSNDLSPTASFDLMTNMSRLLTRTVSGLSRIVSPQKTPSPVITTQLKEQVQSLRADDENYVAKVTPDRIYSVAFHPSSSVLIACAGDKQGYLGLWNVDKPSDTNLTDDYNGVHLFKIHTSPISTLQWNPLGSALYSISYDSTVRKFDVTSQKFLEAFATYDSSEKYKDKMGYDMDDGNRAWIQYGCLDPKNEESMFLSTSDGNVLHLDFRSGTVNFNVHLSEKKINTVR
jgi:WD40 repeat protein